MPINLPNYFSVPGNHAGYFIISVSAHVWDIPNQKDTLLPSRMHVMAGLLPSEADRTDKELMAQWEATYVKNMKYAAQRLEEVISHGWSRS